VIGTESIIDSVKGPFSRIEYAPIDLNSHDQVKKYLSSIGWKPTQWNKSKKTGEITSPKLTEDSFDSIEDDTGQLVARRNVIVHRRRTILNYADPENKGIIAKIRDDGRVPATGILCGTPTGRTKHSGAVCNVPKASPKVIYGVEMRSLFCVKDPYVMLGADLDGIEARVTAHYAFPYDGGQYASDVLDGDIHQKNADMLGVARDPTAKAFQYATYYGARAAKIAGIVGCSVKKAQQLLDAFWAGNIGVHKLVQRLTAYYKKHKFIRGLDGRKLMIRAEYKLLNSLIQSAAGIIFKMWGVMVNRKLREEGLDCRQIMAVHDEFSYRCLPAHVDRASQIIRECALLAGEYFKVNVPITADVKVGMNWAEVH
jgi:DNA polymerase I-like protein with 3'-5' exonuclease and polymerase domains